MYIVIDGYNLLKLVNGQTHISEEQRSAFVNLLGRYKLKRGHKITIVFDAGPCVYPLKEKQHGVSVIFSGEHQTADDVIVQFVKNNATKELAVITADREIISHVERLGAEVIKPLVFYTKVKEAFKKSSEALKRERATVVKTTDTQDSDLDDLMLQAAGMKNAPKDENDQYQAPRHHQPRGAKVSKKERKRLKKMDKL